MKEITVSNNLLRHQIYALLNSNLEEDVKEGLHNLLSEINAFTEKEQTAIIRGVEEE